MQAVKVWPLLLECITQKDDKMRGRPTLLGQKLDTLAQKLLRASRYKGGVMNTQTALTKALVKRYQLLEK